MKIILLGAGKLGKQLYAAFVNHPKINLIQWYQRGTLTERSSEGIPITSSLSKIYQADIYLLAISDDSVAEVAQKLPSTALVVHTAGSVQMNVIPQKRKGVFYPLQSFSNNQLVDFSTIPIGIEATEEKDVTLLMELAQTIGSKPKILSSEQREIVHLAAVLVNNFTNHLLTQAAKLCEAHNLPFELLRPLLIETVRKTEQSTPHESQTGPALRNDQKTLSRHLKLIENPELKKIYITLTSAIQNHYENEKL